MSAEGAVAVSATALAVVFVIFRYGDHLIDWLTRDRRPK